MFCGFAFRTGVKCMLRCLCPLVEDCACCMLLLLGKFSLACGPLSSAPCCSPTYPASSSHLPSGFCYGFHSSAWVGQCEACCRCHLECRCALAAAAVTGYPLDTFWLEASSSNGAGARCCIGLISTSMTMGTWLLGASLQSTITGQSCAMSVCCHRSCLCAKLWVGICQ